MPRFAFIVLSVLIGCVLCFGVTWVSAQQAETNAPAVLNEEPETAQPKAAPTPGVTNGQAVLQALPSGSKVAVVPIQGMIYGFTLESLERRVDRALANGVTVIVLEIDTPGGVVTSALDICKYLKNLGPGVTTVAWINDQAYSAGTMIASACDVIVMSPSSTFGDSAPVSPLGNLERTERLKALSPVLAEYKDNAQTNGYDYAPFHAMCVLDIELYYVEHKDTGQRRVVNQTDFGIMVNGTSFDDAMATHVRVTSDDDEKLAMIAAPAPTVTQLERGRWKPVETLPSGASLPNGLIHDGTTLYTLSQTEAIDLGLATAIVPDQAALEKRLNAGTVWRVETTWSESLAYFLTHPLARGILVVVLLVGAYIELQAPGLGVPGFLAAVALVILLVAPFLVGLAETWHVLMMIAGLALLIVELVAVPTFGLMGVAGILMVIAGLALSVVPTDGTGTLPMPATGTGDLLMRSTLSTLGAFFLALVAMIALTQFYGKIPFLNRLILNTNAPGSLDPQRAPAPLQGDHVLGGDHRVAIGRAATVSSTGLRPSGTIEIDGQLIDAVSTGSYIDPGTPVRITEIHGNRIVVDTDENATV